MGGVQGGGAWRVLEGGRMRNWTVLSLSGSCCHLRSMVRLEKVLNHPMVFHDCVRTEARLCFHLDDSWNLVGSSSYAPGGSSTLVTCK